MLSQPVTELHTLHFNTTNSCNLACSFCYIDASRTRSQDIPLARIPSLAAEAKRAGAVKVILSGGEPLARKDWRQVFGAFDEAGFVLSVVSNGTLMDEAAVQTLRNFRQVEVLVSVDGDERYHDRIRGRAGAHALAVSAAERLLAAGLPVQLNATLMRDNVGDVPYFVKLSRDLDVSFRLTLLNPQNGRGRTMTDAALDLQEIIGVRDFCHAVRQRGSRVFLNAPPLLLYAEDIISTRGPACGWTRHQCGLTHDGFVTVCGVAGNNADLYTGNIMEQPFDEIWAKSTLFNRLRTLTVEDLQGICGRCPFRSYCGGACRLLAYETRGDFTAPNDLCQTLYDQGYVPEAVLAPI